MIFKVVGWKNFFVQHFFFSLASVSFYCKGCAGNFYLKSYTPPPTNGPPLNESVADHEYIQCTNNWNWQSFISGTIFAYGQTSSGKTFTMLGNVKNPGVIGLAMEEIFSYITMVCFLLNFSYFTDSLCWLLLTSGCEQEFV